MVEGNSCLSILQELQWCAAAAPCREKILVFELMVTYNRQLSSGSRLCNFFMFIFLSSCFCVYLGCLTDPVQCENGQNMSLTVFNASVCCNYCSASATLILVFQGILCKFQGCDKECLFGPVISICLQVMISSVYLLWCSQTDGVSRSDSRRLYIVHKPPITSLVNLPVALLCLQLHADLYITCRMPVTMWTKRPCLRTQAIYANYKLESCRHTAYMRFVRTCSEQLEADITCKEH